MINFKERVGLDYTRYREEFRKGTLIQSIAKANSVSEEVVTNLARDPDHNNKITLSSCIEACVSLEVEKSGIMGITLERGPKKIDVIDGWNRKWDIKTPPYIPEIGFKVDMATNSIMRKFNDFPNMDIGILLCVSFMRKEDVTSLSNALNKLITENMKFHIRKILINGVL